MRRSIGRSIFTGVAAALDSGLAARLRPTFDPVALHPFGAIGQEFLGFEHAAIAKNDFHRSDIGFRAGHEDARKAELGRLIQRQAQYRAAVSGSTGAWPNPIADVAAFAAQRRRERVADVRHPDDLGAIAHEPIRRMGNEACRNSDPLRAAVKFREQGVEVGVLEGENKRNERLSRHGEFSDELTVRIA